MNDRRYLAPSVAAVIITLAVCVTVCWLRDQDRMERRSYFSENNRMTVAPDWYLRQCACVRERDE